MIDGGVSEVLLGALIGVVLTELVSAVKKAKHKVAMFEPTINEMEAILEYAQRVLHCNNNNNNNKYVSELRELMPKGTKLVLKCSTFHRWEYVRKIRYRKKLFKLNKDLVWNLILYIQNQTHRFQNRNHTILLALINLQNNMMDN